MCVHTHTHVSLHTHAQVCTHKALRINQRVVHFADRKSKEVSYNWWSQVTQYLQNKMKLQAISIIIKPQSTPFQLLPLYSLHMDYISPFFKHSGHLAVPWPLPVPLPWIPFSSSSSLKFKQKKYPYILISRHSPFHLFFLHG